MAQVLAVHPTHPQPRLLRIAADALKGGGLIAYPTDSCYALGCRLGDAEATRRIRSIRGLEERHPLTLMCRDLAAVGRFARIDNWQFRIIRQGTPGSFTFLLPATRDVPRRLQHPRRSTIGVRIPDHAVARALLAALEEPIVSTTLMPAEAGEPLNDAAAIRDHLGKVVDVIIDAGPCAAIPTTVVDLAAGAPVVIRLGLGDPARLGIVGNGSGMPDASRPFSAAGTRAGGDS
jgi:tRNA threonylcarbamoyl adenosine modification protein (Sua5/YciO/YrdC/YwlC family)